VKPPGKPLFLARRPYRRRRVMDAARLLPLLGGFLFLLPMLWAPRPEHPRSTAGDGIYLFVVWGILIAIAALLAMRLGSELERGGPDETAPERPEDADGGPQGG